MENRSQDRKISIIIVTYNNILDINRLLQELLEIAGHFPIEIIVIDNNSHDGTREILEHYQNSIRLIINEENVGFAPAVNIGIDMAQTPYLMLLNPDISIDFLSIQSMYHYCMQHKHVAAVAPRILNVDGTLQPSRGSFPNIFRTFVHLARIKKIMPSDEACIRLMAWPLGKLFKQYSRPEMEQTVDYTTGACVLLNNQAVQEVGGMDERFFLYYEEIDLALRFKRKGYRWVFLNSISVYHKVAASSSQAPLLPYFERYKSMLLFYQKHHSKLAVFCVKLMLAVAVSCHYSFAKMHARFRIDPNISWLEEKNTYRHLLKLCVRS
ncbi:glycosyltransferase family 2 protein [bacterium]|nr:glycosyltransferase family 2 protein [candidate division CSSED10-310 bacterium]